MCRGFLLTATSALIEALCILPATAVEMQPGFWELTSRINRDGVGSTRPVRVRCVTAERANATRSMTDLDVNSGLSATLGASSGRDACKLTEAKSGKDVLTWRLQCTGSPSLTKEFSARVDSPRHYVAVTKTSITLGNKTLTVVSTTEGHYKGECPR
jgi:hypothetical protein